MPFRYPGAPLYAGYARQALIGKEGRHSPALLAGAAQSLLGGLGLGGGPNKAKQAIRLRNIFEWGKAAITRGDKDSLRRIEGIAQGLEGFGVAINAETVGAAQRQLQAIHDAQEEAQGKASAASAAGAAREARFLQAGTSIAGSVAGALARGSRRPARRRTTRRRTTRYPAGY